MIQFPMAQYSILESESNITVCINLLSGPEVILRNVSVEVFSRDGTAALGGCKSVSRLIIMMSERSEFWLEIPISVSKCYKV